MALDSTRGWTLEASLTMAWSASATAWPIKVTDSESLVARIVDSSSNKTTDGSYVVADAFERCPLVLIGAGAGFSGLTTITKGDDCSGNCFRSARTRLSRPCGGIALDND